MSLLGNYTQARDSLRAMQNTVINNGDETFANQIDRAIDNLRESFIKYVVRQGDKYAKLYEEANRLK